MSFKQVGWNISDAAITAGVFAGVDRLYYQNDINAQMFKNVGVSFGAELLSDTVTTQVAPLLMKSGTAQVNHQYLHPVVSGGLYTVGSTLVGDSRSFLHRFLHQTGSSIVAGYIGEPIKKAIGAKY